MEDTARKSRFAEPQIIGILEQAEAGWQVTDLRREHAVTQTTFCRLRGKYGGMEASDAQELNRLRDENRRLEQLVRLAPSRRLLATHPAKRLCADPADNEYAIDATPDSASNALNYGKSPK